MAKKINPTETTATATAAPLTPEERIARMYMQSWNMITKVAITLHDNRRELSSAIEILQRDLARTAPRIPAAALNDQAGINSLGEVQNSGLKIDRLCAICRENEQELRHLVMLHERQFGAAFDWRALASELQGRGYNVIVWIAEEE